MTEGTAYGGCVSIVGAALMIALFLGELSNYMTVESSSKVTLLLNAVSSSQLQPDSNGPRYRPRLGDRV